MNLEVKQGGGGDGVCRVARCLGGATVSENWLANKASVGVATEENSADNTAIKELVKLSCMCLLVCYPMRG